jgi:hypothetical protein
MQNNAKTIPNNAQSKIFWSIFSLAFYADAVGISYIKPTYWTFQKWYQLWLKCKENVLHCLKTRRETYIMMVCTKVAKNGAP